MAEISEPVPKQVSFAYDTISPITDTSPLLQQRTVIF
jgi:hypothetical protein